MSSKPSAFKKKLFIYKFDSYNSKERFKNPKLRSKKHHKVPPDRVLSYKALASKKIFTAKLNVR